MEPNNRKRKNIQQNSHKKANPNRRRPASNNIESYEDGRVQYNRTKKIGERNQKSVLGKLKLELVVFAAILLYFILAAVTKFRDDSVARYQVVNGSLSINSIYKGIAIREEEEFAADHAGYVNYYASEGMKAGCGNLVYSIDATGELSSLIENSNELLLTEEELSSIKNEIVHFQNGFTNNQFSKVYDFKTDMNVLISRYRTTNIMENINTINAGNGGNQVGLIRAEKSGIVLYKHDGYENLTKDSVTVADLDDSKYESLDYVPNTLVASGDLVYKMVKSEKWSLAVLIDEAVASKLSQETYIQVKFLKTQEISWAATEIKRTPDGILLFLDFNNSMITFCNDRYVDIELMLSNETGLKIPNSAIETKEFLLVPVEFVCRGGDSQKEGVLVEHYTENGDMEPVFTEIEIYNETDAYYYVNADMLSIGTYLIAPTDCIRRSTGRMDPDEIKEQYEVQDEAYVGVVSNVYEEGEDHIINEGGEVKGQALSEEAVNQEEKEASQEGNSEENSSNSEENSSNSEENANSENQENESKQHESSEGLEGENAENTNEGLQGDGEGQQNVVYYPGDRLALNMKGTLIGVYNMNKGYADFRQITILYQNDEYAIVKANTNYGLCEYDYIVLNASSVKDQDFVK